MYTPEQREARIARAMPKHHYSEMRDEMKSECIAYGLACGFGSLAESDADIERNARRMRWERRKAKR